MLLEIIECYAIYEEKYYTWLDVATKILDNCLTLLAINHGDMDNCVIYSSYSRSFPDR